MTTEFLISITIFECIFLIILLIKSLKKKENYSLFISGMILFATLILISYFTGLFSSSDKIGESAYSLYFISNTFMCLFLFLFSGAYAKRKLLPWWGIVIVTLLVTSDVIILSLNPFNHFAATFSIVRKGSLICRDFHQQPYFVFHLFYCYVYFGVFILNMMIEMIKAPSLIKRKYIVQICIFLIIFLLNFIFLFTEASIDVSVLTYSFSGFLMYFFSYTFIPNKLIKDTGFYLLAESNLSFYIFDKDKKCIYQNKSAIKTFSLTNDDTCFADLTELFNYKNPENEKLVVSNLVVDDEVKYFRLKFVCLNDKKNRNMGFYFTVEDITSEQLALKRKNYIQRHDILTEVYNENAFYEEARKLLDNSDEEYQILLTNIRQFKILNDYLGRETGDKVLQVIGKILHTLTKKNVVYGRLRGDKFAICVPIKYNLQEDFLIKTQIVYEINSFSLAICLQLGIYNISDKNNSVSSMCDKAMIALNTIKNSVKLVAFYDDKIRNDLLFENQLISDFTEGIDESQFEVYYQIQMNSKTKKIVGAEALVRWNHPTKGLIYPGSFVPCFERTGLIYSLDKYVWEESCSQLKKLRDEGFDISISVNISPQDFYSGDVYSDITRIVKKYNISPQNFRLEITESVVIMNVEKLVSIVNKFIADGFVIEMDDFGSGYSSLNTLKNIPVNVIKMDMKFFDNSSENIDINRSKSIIQVIVQLAKQLSAPLIAEGVETEEQKDYLISIGCTNIQGYFYSKPVPYNDFRKLLDEYEIGSLE